MFTTVDIAQFIGHFGRLKAHIAGLNRIFCGTSRYSESKVGQFYGRILAILHIRDGLAGINADPIGIEQSDGSMGQVKVCHVVLHLAFKYHIALVGLRLVLHIYLLSFGDDTHGLVFRHLLDGLRHTQSLCVGYHLQVLQVVVDEGNLVVILLLIQSGQCVSQRKCLCRSTHDDAHHY